MCGATDVNGGSRTADDSVPFASDVVRIDLHSHRSESSPVYVQYRTDRCKGLGEGDRRPAVEKSEGLTGPRIDRHCRGDPLGADFCELDTQGVLQPARFMIVQPREPVCIFRHPES